MTTTERLYSAFQAGLVRRIGWSAALLILLLPAIAMLAGADVNWGPGDFLVAAFLLGGTGLAIELAVRLFDDARLRVLCAALALLALLLVWAELAVGIFGG